MTDDIKITWEEVIKGVIKQVQKQTYEQVIEKLEDILIDLQSANDMMDLNNYILELKKRCNEE